MPLDGVCVVRMRDGLQQPSVGGRSRDYFRGDMFAVPPGMDISIRAEALDEDVLFLDLEHLEDVAQHTLGAGLRRDAFRDLSTADSARLRVAGPLWSQLVAVLTGTDLQRYPLLYDDTERLLALSVVDLFDALEDVPERGGPAGVVRRAEEAMRSRSTEPVTMSTIADDLGVSVRHLHDSFRSQTGTTPMRHLRGVRLAAAHEESTLADPASSAAVADIAHRWGFAHLGRFAQYYRAEYGELPRDTLRR